MLFSSRHHKVAVLLFALLGQGALAISEAQADDNCDCDRYLSLIPQYTLTDEVADIGEAALHQQGHVFQTDEAMARMLKKSVKQDLRIPAECRSYVASRVRNLPKESLVVSGTAAAPEAGFKISDNYPSSLMDTYNALIRNAVPCDRPSSASGSAGAAYRTCLETKAPAAFDATSKAIAADSPQALIDRIRAVTGTSVTTTDAAVLKAYSAALNSGSEAGLKAWASSTRGQLSTDQFLNVVQMVGWELNTSYSFDRANSKNGAGKGIVSVSEALSSLKNNSAYMITGPTDPAAPLAEFKVVCRDAAIVQTTMLAARGMKAFAVTYQDASGGHTDVITQYPGERHKFAVINWWGRSVKDRMDGSRALFQGNGDGIPDYSPSYTISAANGRTIGNVPSEMGKFLTEVAGGNINVWDPLARSTSSIMAATYSPDSKGIVQLRSLDGTDGNGANYAGMGASAAWGVNTKYPGQVGVFAGHMLRPGAVYGESTGGAFVAYAQVEQHLLTPRLKLSPEVSAVLDTHAIAAWDVSHISSGPDLADGEGRNNYTGFNHRIGTEIRVDQKTPDSKVQAQYTIGGNSMIYGQDVRNSDPSDLRLIPLSAYASARATIGAGKIKFFGQVTAVLSQLGARDRVEIGVIARKIAFSAYEAGDLSNHSMAIEDNSIRRVGAGLTFAPSETHVRVNITGETPIDESNPLKDARIFGSLVIKR